MATTEYALAVVVAENTPAVAATLQYLNVATDALVQPEKSIYACQTKNDLRLLGGKSRQRQHEVVTLRDAYTYTPMVT